MEVRLEVVYADERNAQRLRKPLGGVDPNDEGGREAGAVRHGDGVNGAWRTAHGLADDLRYLLDMRAGGDLRDYAAVRAVQGNLREHDVRKHLSAVAHDGGSGFVATRLDSEYVHGPYYTKSFLAAAGGSNILLRPLPKKKEEMRITAMYCDIDSRRSNMIQLRHVT